MFDDPTQAALWVRPARSGVRVACAACGLNLEAHAIRARLCVACGADADLQTRAVAAVVACEERTQVALDALSGAVPGAGPLAERWITYQHSVALAALGAPGAVEARRKVRVANEAARAGRADALLDIVRAWLDYTTALRALQLAEERVARIAEALL